MRVSGPNPGGNRRGEERRLKKYLTPRYWQITNADGTSVEIYDKSTDLSVTITDPIIIVEWTRLTSLVRALPISDWNRMSEELFGKFFDEQFHREGMK
jgi:hypothetical protein